MTTITEPRVRRDGRCAVCRKERKVPKPLQKGVPEQAYELDPFCSATCAREYYKNPIRKAAVSAS